jgi:hypothetical protein
VWPSWRTPPKYVHVVRSTQFQVQSGGMVLAEGTQVYILRWLDANHYVMVATNLWERAHG